MKAKKGKSHDLSGTCTKFSASKKSFSPKGKSNKAEV